MMMERQKNEDNQKQLKQDRTILDHLQTITRKENDIKLLTNKVREL